ncbi:DUF6366 family protein [Oceanobacillus massiliensis]|uniref:DUF6366 family protein n=1 Tax=Oceanobacillus massiliensis TaxID=1465765 RepID=UPI000289265C|nr:DUF6366 family protein [Oceanobacillus massiliensis]
MNEKEAPEQKRERLRQEELKKNPIGNAGDAFNSADSGNLADLVGGLGWKGTGLIIAAIIVGLLLYSLFFR